MKASSKDKGEKKNNQAIDGARISCLYISDVNNLMVWFLSYQYHNNDIIHKYIDD